jgi:hypothetical protein
VPGVTFHLDDLVVGWADRRPVAMSGGRIRAVGRLEDLAQAFERWRARYLRAGPVQGGEEKGGGFGGFEVRWQEKADDPTRSLSATGVSLGRTARGMTFAAAHLRATIESAQLDLDAGRLSLVRDGEGYRVAELASDALELELGLGSALALMPLEAVPADLRSAAAHPATPRGPEPPLPAGSERPKAPPAVASANGRVASAQLVHRSLVTMADKLRGLLEQEAQTKLAGVRCVLHVGQDVLNLGPGTLSFARDDEAFVVVLSPSGTPPAAPEGQQPAQTLTFSLRIPLAASGSRVTAPVVAEVHGGPVWLSTLGIKEGDLGLADVAHASVEADAKLSLAADGSTVSIDGRGKLHQLSVASAKLATEPLRGMELGWRARAELGLDGRGLRVDEGAVDLGDIHLGLSGSYRRGESGLALEARFEVALMPCQQAFASIPAALVPNLAGMRFAGSLGAKGEIRFDQARLDQTYSLGWDGTNSCRVVEIPPGLAAERFRKTFRRTVWDGDGKATELAFGPGSNTWAPYGTISRFMEVAVLTTEDGRFFRHHGFDAEAIVNSIRENLRTGRFVRGASTISMQLARNLYLGHEKTISRKLQEAILTLYLEQELTKQELMELYLNVIEFGPMVYGVGPAARHYFHSSPNALSLGQALYLSSILPKPTEQHFGAGGAVSAGHSGLLRRLMRNANKSKRISDDELEEGLRETVIFGSPSPARAPKEAGSEPNGTGGAEPTDGTGRDGD